MSADAIELPTSDATERFGAALAGALGAGDVVVLTGALGAGKTTLTRGLGEALGVRGPVSSPTFVLARTHPSLVGGPELVHVDAYRLRDALELDDLDLDLDASVTIVEWGRDVVDAIVDSWLDVELVRPRATAETDPDEVDEPRRVLVTGHGPRWSADRVEAVRELAAAAADGPPDGVGHPGARA